MNPQSVQKALDAEYAAVWIYGLASAFIREYPEILADSVAAHRARRDSAERLMRDAGLTSAPAAPAYVTPDPVRDQLSAIAALIVVENDACVAWRAVLDRSDSSEQALRQIALDGLTNSAVRATRWRKIAGDSPAAPALPGTPN